MLNTCYIKLWTKKPKYFTIPFKQCGKYHLAHLEEQTRAFIITAIYKRKQIDTKKPFLLVAWCLVEEQLNNEEDEPGTMHADESQGWSFASLGQLRAFLESSLLHQLTND